MDHAGGPVDPIWRGGGLALLAAATFGVTTPLIQKLGHDAGAVPTATLLYAGATLATLGGFGRWKNAEPPVRPRHFGRLAAVALTGSVFAPACLAWGLQHTSGVGASLLLNLEGTMTLALAWLLFGEPVGRRVGFAILAMTLGGALLVLRGGSSSVRPGWGACAVVLATLGWAIDNTLTRPLADLDATQVVRWKGALGASFGLALSLVLRQPFPRLAPTLGLLACGATGYGLSLRLYLLAQRQIGAGRTGSIFAFAPFVGALVAWGLGERGSAPSTLAAGGLFGLGVLLHLTERHRHFHTHEVMVHEHSHRHDDGHHEHAHELPITRAHSHVHRHDRLAHDHPHAPDLHHPHRHE